LLNMSSSLFISVYKIKQTRQARQTRQTQLFGFTTHIKLDSTS
jgi:hypothetical protein